MTDKKVCSQYGFESHNKVHIIENIDWISHWAYRIVYFTTRLKSVSSFSTRVQVSWPRLERFCKYSCCFHHTVNIKQLL